MSDERPPLPRPRELEESAALFVGGTSGVGLAAAIKLARAGVPRIGLIGRNAERGAAARQAVLTAAPEAQVEFVAANMTDRIEAERGVTEIHQRLGRIDTLLTTTHAGTVPHLLFKMPPEEIEPMVLGHLMGVLYACRFVVPIMRAQRGGSIITVSSDAAKIATPGEAVMGGLMAAIVMFTRTLAMEGKRDGIRANALTPALIVDTPTNERLQKEEFAKKLFASAEKMAALGLTDPEDQANLILFLASPASARLTGQAISVNGGMSAA